MVNLPFSENGNVRFFSKDTNPEDLKWHYDEQDRDIYSGHETDWQIQFDNELPQQIKKVINIPKNKYHRLIKGTNDLYLVVIKHENT